MYFDNVYIPPHQDSGWISHQQTNFHLGITFLSLDEIRHFMHGHRADDKPSPELMTSLLFELQHSLSKVYIYRSVSRRHHTSFIIITRYAGRFDDIEDGTASY